MYYITVICININSLQKKTLDILRVFNQPFQVLLSEFASFFKKSLSEARLDQLDLQR